MRQYRNAPPLRARSPNALQFGWQLDGEGGATMASLHALEPRPAKAPPLWYHFDATHADTEKLLEQTLKLDWIVIEALLAEETRPRALEYQDGLLVILRGVNLNEGAEPEDMVSIRIWITGSLIISTGVRQLKAVRVLQEYLEKKSGPKTTGDWLTTLCIQVYDNVQQVLTELNTFMDDLEDQIHTQHVSVEDRSIITFRRRVILIKRYLAPQRDVLNHIRNMDIALLNTVDRRRLLEAHDWLQRYVEDLDTLRERAQIVRDELDGMQSKRLNRNLFLLSLVAAVFLPPTLLTGLFGVNVGGVPGAQSDIGFSVLALLIVGTVVLEIVLLKRKRWF